MNSRQNTHLNNMPNQPQTESRHASISFTAHYTGEMWQKLGLSHPALATQKGKRLHRLVAPIERFAKTFFGVTMGKTLTVRHQLIDDRITQFLTTHPDAQIVEFAAGLSPRGWRFMQKYPNLTYIEVDLPAMSALKQERAENLPKPTPQFFAADVLEDNLAPIFGRLDTAKPVIVVTEGLINYFPLDMLTQLGSTIALQIQPFSAGKWITENYPYSDKPSYNALVKTAAIALRTLSRSSFSFYFDKPADAATFFQKSGFKSVDFFQPSQAEKAENKKHLGDTVWIIEMSV